MAAADHFRRGGTRKSAGGRRLGSRRLGVEGLEDRRMLSGNPRLVKDINPPPESLGSEPGGFVQAGDKLYFVATDAEGGRELWSTDGASGGTTRVKDINVGAGDSSPYNLTAVGHTLYFGAYDGATIEVWRSDGTEAGTFPLTTFGTPSFYDHSIPARSLTPIGNTVYFLGPTPRLYSGTPQLWRTDGTVAGTQYITTPSSPLAGSIDFGMVPINATLYFSLNGHLWKSDGTAAGTVEVKPGGGGDDARQLTKVGNTLYYVATDSEGDSELWKSDGTPAGTMRLTDFDPGHDPNEYPYNNGPFDLVDFGGVLHFFTIAGNDHLELRKITGPSGGTALVKDLGEAFNIWQTNIRSLGNALFFSTPDSGSLYHLWTSDGTTAGTAPVGSSESQIPITVAALGGTVYASGESLMRIDVTATGATAVSLGPISGPITPFGNSLFYAADNGVYGSELWKSNGAPGGATLVKDITQRAGGSTLWGMANFGGLSYFTADAGGKRRLWRTDGTTAGTVDVDSLLQGGGTLEGWGQIELNGGALYFSRYNATGGVELWKSQPDGSAAARVAEVIPGSAQGSSLQLAVAGDLLYLSAFHGDETQHLWRSDGTAAGTIELARIYSRPTPVGDLVYFHAWTPSAGFELWVTDGTPGSAHMVKDITPGTNYSALSDFTNVDGRLFFIENYEGGRAIWTSDGTDAGTIKLKSLSYDSGVTVFPYFPQMAAMNGYFYFFINTAGTVAELWRSNGTVAGTTAVRHFNKTDANDSLRQLTVVGDHLYFLSNAGLWKSDGTGGGTNVIPPPGGGALSGMRDFVAVDGRLFFYAYQEGGSGPEIWSTDGTAAGTRRWTDFTDPPATSHGLPSALLGALGTQLFFTADDGIHGRELFALNTAPSGAGDFDGDGHSNGNDFLAWQRALGSGVPALGASADGNASGHVDAGDLDVWRSAVVAVPSLRSDFNGDARIDGSDFLQWQRKLGSHDAAADGDGDGIVDAEDLSVWRAGFAAEGAAAAASSMSASAAAAAAVVADDDEALEERLTLTASADVENLSAAASASLPFSELPGSGIRAADAVFAAGDFTGLFASASEVGGPGSRNYRPRRRF